MLLALFLGRTTVVAHVLAITLYTDLKVTIAMEISKLAWMDATLAMETIGVLTNDSLEFASVHQLNESHVSSVGSRLLHCHAKGLASGRR